MQTVNIHRAKTHFSRLVDEAARGREIVIARAGKPVARLVPLAAAPRRKRFGLLKGRIRMSADFNAALPAGVLDQFEGRER
jgi:prevent-host-death family protein